MTGSLWKRGAKRTEKLIWGGVLFWVGISCFCAGGLPRIIAAWTVRGEQVAPWMVQVPIDAVYMIGKERFVLFPLLLLWAFWTSYLAMSSRVK